jgi:hypothetical protein
MMTPATKCTNDPSDERLREIAAILAAGILRLHARAALPTPEKPETPPQNCLEVRAETVLSVHTS